MIRFWGGGTMQWRRSFKGREKKEAAWRGIRCDDGLVSSLAVGAVQCTAGISSGVAVSIAVI